MSLLSGIWAHSQTFSIDWSTVAGGGGTSTGGNFAVNATIAQPLTTSQPLTGNGSEFSLLAGFWSLVAVQTPGAPFLSISFNPQLRGVTVSWPSPAAGFVLQQTGDLDSTNWSTVVQPVNDNGTSKFIVIINPPGGKRFYRLFKP